MYSSFFRQATRRIKLKGKSVYARITLNRFSTAIFLFSFFYCFAQGIIQSLLYSIDVQYSGLLSGIVSGGHIPSQNVTWQEGTGKNLLIWMCDDIPILIPVYPCTVIFNASQDSPKYNPNLDQSLISSQGRILEGWENGLDVTSHFNPLNATEVTAVEITPRAGPSITISEQCTQILVYPSQMLRNLKTEDLGWICLQFWLLAISVVAIVNDSVPHILAVLMTRTIYTAWAMYSVWRVPYYRQLFLDVLADPGTPCSVDLFTDFWTRRQGFEIGDLLLSCTGLLLFSYLSWNLLKTYSAESFKCVGAPEHVMRIHKFFLAVLACLQLEAFILITSVGLWIDVLMNTAIKEISSHTAVYDALFISTVILMLPWIMMGWYSIKKEMKTVMIIFLAIGFVILSGWAIMFYSEVYRWTFIMWPYFGCFTVASIILLVSSITLGVVCRMNFGKGLAEYLHAEETLASLNFAPDAFAHRTVTFASDFKSDDLLDKYSLPMHQMKPNPRTDEAVVSSKWYSSEEGKDDYF
jgi:hypothetical protein